MSYIAGILYVVQGSSLLRMFVRKGIARVAEPCSGLLMQLYETGEVCQQSRQTAAKISRPSTLADIE